MNAIRARYKPKRISSFEFAAAVAALALVEAALLINFAVMPQKRLADEAAANRAAYEAMQEKSESNSRDVEAREARLAELTEMIGQRERMLPAVLRNEDIANDIGAYAASHNVNVTSLSFSSRTTADPYEYATQELAYAASGARGAASDVSAASGVSATPTAADVSIASDVSTASTASAGSSDSAASQTDADSTGISQTDAYLADSANMLTLQVVQVAFSSEFHTLEPFIAKFEDSERRVKVKSLSITREQEGVVSGVLALEYAALSQDAEGDAGAGGFDEAELPPAGGKGSLFERYEGYVEDGVDPNIVLVSAEDDIDPDFYMILNSSASNDTKITFGVYPRTETELYYNANNAARATLRVTGDAEQFEYTYSLGSSAPRTEKRKLSAVDGRLRVDVVSHPRTDDNDSVDVVLDIDNETTLPLEVRVRNDDVLEPRFHIGETQGQVSVKP